jgi:hypothetical protein
MMRYLTLLLLLLLTACVQPANTPTATPGTSIGSQVITLIAPLAGAITSSPLVVRGATQQLPEAGTLTYRVFDASETLIGSGIFAVEPNPNGGSAFNAPITYRASSTGSGRLEVLELAPNDGQVRALVSVAIVLTASGDAPATRIPELATPISTPTINAVTPLPATTISSNGQLITIETPPIGTIVGSPVTITGRATRDPAGGQFTYRVRDMLGQQLGAGTLATVPAPGGASFIASLTFVEPPNGGQIVVEISDPGRSQASIQLLVAPPQAITIETPAAGTLVGSPMTITGRTARLPFQGALSYRVFDTGNRQLGAGLVFAQGSPGQASRFTGELTFSLPAVTTDLRIELSDEDAVSGIVAARQSLMVRVAPPPASLTPSPIAGATTVPTITTPTAGTLVITIDRPAPVAVVTSPIAISGRVNLIPANGLRYRIRDAAGRIIGEGQVPLQGATGQPGTFALNAGFVVQQAGPIVLEIGEPDTAGNLRSTAVLVLTASISVPTAYPAP